jgi:hypothetical protein
MNEYKKAVALVRRTRRTWIKNIIKYNKFIDLEIYQEYRNLLNARTRIIRYTKYKNFRNKIEEFTNSNDIIWKIAR